MSKALATFCVNSLYIPVMMIFIIIIIVMAAKIT